MLHDFMEFGLGGDADDADVSLDQAVDDTGLDPAVDERDGLLQVFIIDFDFFRCDLRDQVPFVRVGNEPGFAAQSAKVGFRGAGFENAEHDPLDSQFFRERPRVHSADAGDAVFLEPIVKRFFRSRMRRRRAQLAHDVSPDFRPVGFKTRGADAVVADERVGLAEDLAVIGGIGDGFGVANHARVENDFSRDFGRGAKAFARPDASVFKDQDRFQPEFLLLNSAHYIVSTRGIQYKKTEFYRLSAH